jgi:hemerythrin-like domain-containing protein
MVIQIGLEEEGSFANPVRLLNDCHRRIEMFLSAMITVTRQAQGAGLNESQRVALEGSLLYFREAAPKHTQDEEESLFPRLFRLRHPRVQSVVARLEKLKDDHAVADRTHREVEALLREWLDRGRLPADSVERLTGALQGLSDHYRKHIRLEESEIFPVAEETLDPSDLDAIGREMAERRGIDPEKI